MAALIVIGCFTKHRVVGLLFVHGIDMGGIGESPVRRYGRFYRGRRARNAVRFSLEIRVTGCAALFSRYPIASRTMAARSIRFTPVRFNPPIDLSLPLSPVHLTPRYRCSCVFANWNFRPCSAKQLTVAWSTSQAFFIPIQFFSLLFFFSSLSFFPEWKCDGLF